MIYKIIPLAMLILLGQVLIPSYAITPESTYGQQNPFNNPYIDIKLLDAYFGPAGQKMEVQPGDKNVPFTIVLANTGTDDITGIKGLLSLPLGFSPASGNGPLIEADNTQVATSGKSFTLTFFINLDKNTNIQQYPGTVQISYSRVRENGVHTDFFDFNFKVTGLSVLNMKAQDPFIAPASNNQIAIQVSNGGTGALNNVDIALSQQSNSSTNLQNVVIDQHHWNIGTIIAQSSNTFSFNIFVPPDLAGQTLHLPLTLTYFDGQGNQITTARIVDLIVGPASSTFTVKLSTPSYVMMGVMQNLTLGLQNLSPSKISDISITLTPSSTDLRILQDPRWFVKEINPLESTALNIPVFADQNIVNQAVNYDVNMQYTKDGSTVIEKQSFATYVRPVIDVSVYGVQVSEIAGQKMIIGNVLNQGNMKGQFAVVTIDPQEGSTITEATQYIGDIDVDAPTPFNVPIQPTTGGLSGNQKVLVTLTYKDTLLQTHTITQVDTVSFGILTPPSDNNLQIQLVILVAIAGGIGGILFKMGKIRIPAVKNVKKSS